METNGSQERGGVNLLESVRCLACGSIYSKPAGGGTVRQNPGCPECSYVGWIGLGVSLNEGSQPRRFAADPQPHRVR